MKGTRETQSGGMEGGGRGRMEWREGGLDVHREVEGMKGGERKGTGGRWEEDG